MKVETEYYVFKDDTCCVLSDYYGDDTITVWGFENESTARESKSRSDVGLWRVKPTDK